MAAKPGIAWYNEFLASGITGLSDGTGVASWPDALGSSRALAQGTAANQPLYYSARATLNGKPGVYFDGESDRISVDHEDIAGCVTVALVAYVYESTSGQVVASQKGGIGDAGTAAVIVKASTYSAPNVASIYRGAALDGADAVSGRVALIVWELNGSSSRIWVDGELSVEGNAGTNVWNSGFILGCNMVNNTQSAFCKMDVAYCAVAQQPLTDAEHAAMWAWAHSEYAPASTAPAGTVTISDVDAGSNSATVTYSYTGSDAEWFEARLDGGEPFVIGASPAVIGAAENAVYVTGVQVRAVNAAGASDWSTAVALTTTAFSADALELDIVSDGFMGGPSRSVLYHNGALYFSTVRRFDYATVVYKWDGESLKSAVVAENPIQVHNNASIAIDADGYVYACYCRHDAETSFHLKKSATPYSLDFGAVQNFAGGGGYITYPTILIDPDNRMWVFFNETTGVDTRVAKYRTGIIGSAMDAAVTLFDAGSGKRPYWGLAVDGSEIIVVVSGDHPETSTAGTSSGYFLRWGGSAWEKADGTAYTLPVTAASADKCFDASSASLNLGGGFSVGTNGSELVLFAPAVSGDHTEDAVYRLAHNGTSWSQFALIGPDEDYLGGSTAAIDEDGFYTIVEVDGEPQLARVTTSDGWVNSTVTQITDGARTNGRGYLKAIQGDMDGFGAPPVLYFDVYRDIDLNDWTSSVILPYSWPWPNVYISFALEFADAAPCSLQAFLATSNLSMSDEELKALLDGE